MGTEIEDTDRIGVKEREASDANNIRFIKSQQWTTTYFINLIFAGIFGFVTVGFDDRENLTPFWKWSIVVILELTIFTGWGLILQYHWWLKRIRSSWKEGRIDLFTDKILKRIRSDDEFEISSWRDWIIIIPMMGLIFINGLALILYILGVK